MVAVAHCAVQSVFIVVCGMATHPRENPTGVAHPIDWREMIIGHPLLSRISIRVLVLAEVLEIITARRSLYPQPLSGIIVASVVRLDNVVATVFIRSRVFAGDTTVREVKSSLGFGDKL